MKEFITNRKLFLVVHLLLFVIIIGIRSALAAGIVKPLKVALIIGDQWNDPMGKLIQSDESSYFYGNAIGKKDVPSSSDFYSIIVLLKSWGIPFDIIRLDQQFLNRNHFLNTNNELIYGSIIWLVNPNENLLTQNYNFLSELVEHYSIGFIGLTNYVKIPVVQTILGIQYHGEYDEDYAAFFQDNESEWKLSVAVSVRISKANKRKIFFIDF